MKQYVVLLIVTIVLVLTGCEEQTLDYSDFEQFKATSYSEAETYSENRYIIYYYSESCSHCQTVKQDVLSFFQSFDALPFFLVDTVFVNDVSNLEEFVGTPTLFVMSDGKVYESYIGSDEIQDFISEYSSLEYDYDLFESQHLTTYESVLEIQNDAYILYYYLENCPHCQATKPHFLPWAFTKAAQDIYFMNGAEVEDPDNIPTELLILNSGTPLVVVMSNGQFADEYYAGTDDVIAYIESIGDDEITAEYHEPLTSLPVDDDNDDNQDPEQYSYDDLEENAVQTYTDTLYASDTIHLAYYYNPYCSSCNAIKQDIIPFLLNLTDVQYYVLDINATTETNSIPELTAVPSLFVIVNNQIEEMYVGTNEIPNFMEAYRNGEVDFTIYN